MSLLFVAYVSRLHTRERNKKSAGQRVLKRVSGSYVRETLTNEPSGAGENFSRPATAGGHEFATFIWKIARPQIARHWCAANLFAVKFAATRLFPIRESYTCAHAPRVDWRHGRADWATEWKLAGFSRRDRVTSR